MNSFQYWEEAAHDPDVDRKYICDLPRKEFDKKLASFTGKVLEVGCGVGRLMKMGWYGIDISPSMIEIAKQRRPDCHFKVNDGRTIPYSDDTFDYAYCVLVFQHVAFQVLWGYIREVYRVLKPGGKFLFQFIEGTEQEPFSHHYAHREIVEILPPFTIEHFEKGSIHPLWTWMLVRK